jgi:hypothetical protein
MPNTDKKIKLQAVPARESAYLLKPWGCNHHPTFSEIEAYLPITGNWEIIADIHDTRGVDAEILANLITRAVNGYEKARDMIAQMIVAIELCLACSECLTWEAEQEAQVVLRRARQLEEGP